MKNLFVLLIFALILVGSCRKDNDEPKLKSGYFRLSQVSNSALKSSQGILDDSVKTEFNLGDLKNSKAFYFLLSNGGENPIFDVRLETDNPQFTITPENLSTLPGTGSDNGNAIIPLIELGIVHGTQLNGIGFAELLPMGENTATLTISGKTLEGNDTVQLKSDFYFSINARLMNIRLFDNETEIDLLHPDGALSGNISMGGLGVIRLYYITSNSVRIQNTGNAEISLMIEERDGYGNENEGETIIIPENQSSEIPIGQYLTVFMLESNGTITNDSRIQLGDDGRGYMAVYNSSKDTLP